MNIYEIAKDYEEKMDLILENVNPETGEIIEDEEIKRQLQEELTKDLLNKNEDIVKYIKNLDSTVDSIKDEEKRLYNKRKAIENRIERFKEFVLIGLNGLGKNNVITNLGKIAIRNSKKVNVYNEGLLTNEYLTIKEVKTPNKTKIKEDIENGVIVEGAKIEISQSLNIR